MKISYNCLPSPSPTFRAVEPPGPLPADGHGGQHLQESLIVLHCPTITPSLFHPTVRLSHSPPMLRLSCLGYHSQLLITWCWSFQELLPSYSQSVQSVVRDWRINISLGSDLRLETLVSWENVFVIINLKSHYSGADDRRHIVHNPSMFVFSC